MPKWPVISPKFFRPTRIMSIAGGVALSLVVSGCGLLSGDPPSGEYDGPENIVLIVIDTLRWDRLEATRNGVAVMPQLRAYADENWNFTRAISPGSWTKPSMTSMFTSLYPEVHKVQFLVTNSDFDEPLMTDVLGDNVETLAMYMKGHGYNTAAVQASSVLKETGAEKGFDTYVFKRYPEFKANHVTDTALEALADLEPPFFFYVHYLDPHAQYTPPEKYREMFGPLPEISEQDKELLKRWPNYYKDRVFYEFGLNQERAFGDLSSSARERMRMLYDGEARFIDDEVGRLLKAFRSRYPKTFTIITADHGEELWEHGSVGHVKTVFDEVVHVPLILGGPGLGASRIDPWVQTLDILPTIAARLGLEARPHWQGRSLLDWAVMDQDGSRAVFSHNRSSYKVIGMDQWAVYRGNFKFGDHVHAGEQYFFDLTTDPGETKGDGTVATERVAEMKALLEAHRASNRSHAFHSEGEHEAHVDNELKELIGALGYLE